MAEKEFKKEWENWSKLDRIRFSTYIIFLITFIIILSYWGLFSNEVDILLELFTLKDNNLLNFLYFPLILLGIAKFSNIYYHIIESIFCPNTKDEIEINKKKSILRKKYPFRIVKIMINKYVLENKLKDIEHKLNEFNKLK